MRVPFRPGLVLGTDIAYLPRFLDMEEPNFTRLRSLARRVLTKTEYASMTDIAPMLDVCADRNNPVFQDRAVRHKLRSFVAGRWAAKEAAKKAWGAELLSWQQLEVTARGDEGRPTIHCFLPTDGTGHADAKEMITSQLASLSISHDQDYATAVVLAEPLHPTLRAEFERIMREARAKTDGSLTHKPEQRSI